MASESVQKTLSVALILCVVCAVVVSSAAVILRPTQEENKLLDLKTSIVDLETGRFTESIDIATFDQRKSSKDPATSTALSPGNDPAKIKRRENYATVYIVSGDSGLEKIILPIKGYGLWSTLYGFLALEADLKTVAGIGFYEHAETPGLGGEIDNPKWKASWIGKQAYNEGEIAISVIKGKADLSRPEGAYQIDGLAGATLTTRGVHNLVQFWLGEEGFAPLIGYLKSGDA